MRIQPTENNSFTIKYDLYSNMVYKLSLTYLYNSTDCEDVLQDVFIKLIYKHPNFKDLEHEKRWLLRITVNCCIDKIRKNKKLKTLPLDESLFAIENNEEQGLAKLVVQLPNKLKAPIHLFYYEGYKVNEIAKILGIGSSAVKMRLKRGREMLKIQLEEE